MEQFKAKLARLPIIPLCMIYCAWLGYSYYDWLGSPQSELGQKKATLATAKTELDVSKKKLAAGEEFYKNLDLLRARIRQITAQLDSTKAILNADIDIANFVNMITLEAKKLGLSIKGIKPETEKTKEYYTEVPFTVSVKGAYVQVLVFFDRVAKFQRVIRIADFQMKPTGSAYTKYVELDGSAKLVTYKYVGTQADEIINKDVMKTNDVVLPKSTPAKGAGK